MKVEKRDKRIVEFDDSKIEAAITKAFESNSADTVPVRGLTKEVVQIIQEQRQDVIHIEEIQDIVEDTLMLRGFTEIARCYMKYREKHNEARRILQLMGVVDDLKFGPNAATVLSRYLLKDEEGEPLETPSQLFRRVSGAVASIERMHDEDADVEEYDDFFYSMMANLEFLPNSPTLFNAGTELGQCSACFVLPINDNMDSIFTSLKHMSVVQKSGGGTGFSFSRLRPEGATVGTTGGVASGPISFMKVYDTATDIIKQGGCLSTESLIPSTNGLRRLGSLTNGRLAEERPLNELVFTRDHYRQAFIAANNGLTEVTRVKTDLGYSLDATYNHKIRVITPKGIEWKKTCDLAIGDWVVIKRGGYLGMDNNLPSGPPQHHNATPISLPKSMSPQLSEIVGYFIGDGCLSYLNKKKARFAFSVSHQTPDIAAWIEKFLEDIGITPYREQKENDASWTIGARSVTLASWWITSGFDKDGSKNAEIPPVMFSSSKESLCGFLRGLYEADGDISSYGYPRLSSTSEKLISQVQQVLLSLGIVSRKSVVTKRDSAYGNNPIHTLIITHKPSIELFSNLIGFKSKIKNERFRERIEKASGKASDPIPFAGNLIARYYTPPGRGSGKGRGPRSTNPKVNRELTRYIRGERNPHRIRLMDLSELVPGLENMLSDEVLRDDFIFTKIASLKTLEAYTGDIEVVGSEYVANGFLVHNRRRGANMAILRCDHPDIMNFISCKSDKKSFKNFNISVALTDQFLDALKNEKEIDLIAPHNKKAVQSISARVIFDAIVHNAWSTGDPGLVFIDRINEEHPLNGELVESTNPCVSGDTVVSTERGLLNIQDVPNVIKTAKKMIYILQTKEGYQVKVTKDHRILTPNGWKQAVDLIKGDEIRLQSNEGGFGESGNLRIGQILGWYIGDGWHTGKDRRATLAFYGKDKGKLTKYYQNIVNEELDSDLVIIKSKTREEVRSRRILNLIKEWEMKSKEISNLLLSSTMDCQRGFLQGFFSADGSIQGTIAKGFTVRLSQNNLNNLRLVQIMLLNFGIASRIYENRRHEQMKLMPDGKGQSKLYRTKANHELIISKENIVGFRDRIGFLLDYKQERLVKSIESLKTRGPYKERFMARFDSLTPLQVEDVFDIVGTPLGGFVANGIVVHNCGEQPLLPYESCVLGSINLSRMITDDEIDWSRLEEVVKLAVRFLDNIIDLNVYPVEEIERVTKANRKIGLGIMGFAELLIKLRIPYDSVKGLEKAEEIMSFIRQKAERASADLARIRGNFENFALLKNRNKWKRNASVITVAPTGSISLIAQTSSGIEPLFAIAHSRMLAEGIHLSEVNPLFESVAVDGGFWSDELEHEVAKTGSVQHIDEVPDNIKKVFKAAQEIDPEWHIRMQAAFQKHTDNAVSKCIQEDTLMLTNQGLISVKECGDAKGDDSFGSPYPNLKVISGNGGGTESVLSHYSAGTHPATEIRLKNGASLTGASKTHKILTIDGWKNLGDISVKDLVLVKHKFDPIHTAGRKPISVDYQLRTNAKKMQLHDTMGDELALWLGMIAADGSLVESSGAVGFYEKNPIIGKQYVSLVKNLFNVKPKSSVDPRTGVVSHIVNSRILVRYTKSLIGNRARNKHVPKQILQGNAAEKIAFVNGLTLDGYLKEKWGLVVYEGMSKRLAYETAEILRSFGLPYIYQGKKDVKGHGEAYSVYVSNDLQELIQPLEKHKRSKPRYKKFLVQINPDEVKFLKLPHTHPQYSNLRWLKQSKRNYCWNTVADELGLQIISSVEKVARIEDVGEVPLYDIEVDNAHTYLVNGIVSHNTVNLPNSATTEDIERIYLLANELKLKGTTVFRDGCLGGVQVLYAGCTDCG